MVFGTLFVGTSGIGVRIKCVSELLENVGGWYTVPGNCVTIGGRLWTPALVLNLNIPVKI